MKKDHPDYDEGVYNWYMTSVPKNCPVKIRIYEKFPDKAFKPSNKS